ncbi:MAG: hypothetical protein IJR89_03175 [Clostridia bacterium]|nr:hypothetical protein [Clostridia bacterium]
MKQTGRRKKKERPEEIWSRADAVRELKRVVAVSLEAARQETPGEDGAPARVTYNPSAANAATKAIEVLNRLLGYGPPETEEDGGDRSLTVLFGEGEAYTE